MSNLHDIRTEIILHNEIIKANIEGKFGLDGQRIPKLSKKQREKIAFSYKPTKQDHAEFKKHWNLQVKNSPGIKGRNDIKDIQRTHFMHTTALQKHGAIKAK
jgi:hypothetical protein